MVELQCYKIKVIKEPMAKFGCVDEACRNVDVIITINSDIDIHYQKRAVAHEVLGAYLGVFIHPDILNEIAEAICDAQDDLEYISE